MTGTSAIFAGAHTQQGQPLERCVVLAGHRVVPGGERFTAPARLDPTVLAALGDLVPLAPPHNGAALRVMRWLAAQQPDLEQWACFDIAFHATLPAEAATYAIPADWRHQGLRRFGCHGLSHQHVAEAVDQLPPGRRLLPVRHRGGTKRGHHHGLHPA